LAKKNYRAKKSRKTTSSTFPYKKTDLFMITVITGEKGGY